MQTALLTILVMALTGGCAWFYWQIQQAEARMKAQEATIREQSLLVGELADQISMASQYLYEAMDQNLAEMESRRRKLVQSAPPAESKAAQIDAGSSSDVAGAVPATDEAGAPTDLPAPPATESAAATAGEQGQPERGYHPHFQALTLSAQGIEPVEIARRTGLGVEELRLLMRFQEELSLDG